MLKNYFNDAKPKKVNKAKEVSNSNEYEIYLGTFNDNVFTWYSISKHKELGKAYKEYKKYVNSQLKYTDEELQRVWDTGRLDIELRQGNKLLNWVGIYSREVVKADKTGEDEPKKKKSTKDSASVFECACCGKLVDGKPALVVNDEAFCSECRDAAMRFTPEEQKEYDIDEFGVSNNSYDEYIRCDWCDEPVSKFDAVHELNMGNLCPECVAALRSRGEKLTITDDEKTYDLTNPEDFDKVLEMLNDDIPEELYYEDVPVHAGSIINARDYEDPERIVEISFVYPYDFDNVYHDLSKFFGKKILTQDDIDNFDSKAFYEFLLDEYYEEAIDDGTDPWVEDSVNDRIVGGEKILGGKFQTCMDEIIEIPFYFNQKYHLFCIDDPTRIDKDGNIKLRRFCDPHLVEAREMLGNGDVRTYGPDIRMEVAKIFNLAPQYVQIKPISGDKAIAPIAIYKVIADREKNELINKIASLENQLHEEDADKDQISARSNVLRKQLTELQRNPRNVDLYAPFQMAVMPRKLVLQNPFQAQRKGQTLEEYKKEMAELAEEAEHMDKYNR